MVLIKFAHFILVTAQIIRVDKPDAPFTQQLFRCQGTTRKLCCGCILTGEVLHWVYFKGTHAAITAPDNKSLYFALSSRFL